MKKENKKNMKSKLIIIILLLISIILIGIFRDTNITLSYIAALLVLIADYVFCFQKIKERCLLFMFISSFFVFLMGREFVNLLQYGSISYSFSIDIQFHIVLCLYISLLALPIGFYIVEKYVKNIKQPKDEFHFKNYRINREVFKIELRKYAKIIFIIGWLINLVVMLEQVIYVSNYSYLEYARAFESKIPHVIRLIANFRTIAFFIFLGTMPSKKESIKALALYFIECIGSLFYGDRGNFIIGLLIIILYLVIRQNQDKDKKWITKKHAIILLLCVPFLFAFLSFFVFFREGTPVGEIDIFSQITRFFKSIGNSVNIIGYGKKYEQQLQNIGDFYLIGDIKQYLIYNPITEKIFNVSNIPYHTEAYALSGQSFMHSISYFIDPEKYIAGHGYGSSYIAELFIDLGYSGVALGNLYLGAFMAIFYKIYQKRYVVAGCLLLSYQMMMLLPRAPMDYIITYVFNITAISSAVLIIVLSLSSIVINKKYRRLE